MAKAKKAAAKKAAPKKAAAKKTAATREVLVVASKVKEYIKGKSLQSSADVVPALSEAIYKMLDDAAVRTQGNGRATVRPYDL